MKPVDQEFIHKPESGQYGDCQRAVVASLLELPIAEVPHFLALSKNDPDDYWDRLQAFCRARGFAYLTMPARSGALFFGEAGDVYHEIAGPSPRGNGVGHAVVGCNGQIVFDPHPSRAGLAGDPAKWEHSYLVAVAPASPLTGKYGPVLKPFVQMMERELIANAGKGDRPGWLGMSRDTALLEVYYHLSKLQKASKDQDVPRIVEHSADVANMAMMVLDVCVGMEEAAYRCDAGATTEAGGRE